MSPLDLIPDFLPVIGYMDDLILLPLAIGWTIRLIPAAVMAELRNEAAIRLSERRPRSFAGAAAILLLWIGVGAMLLHSVFGD